jgi:hypothetical protein
MLSGATFKAAAILGTAVFRIVVSNDSIKNATATSQGSSRMLDAARFWAEGLVVGEVDSFIGPIYVRNVETPAS